MQIASVVLHFSDVDATEACVKSLLSLKLPKDTVFKIFVIDNDPNHPFGWKGKEDGVQVIATHKNLGYTGGNNVGIRQALAEEVDYILVLNNDTRLDENCLIKLYKCLEKDERAGIAVPKIYFEKGFEYHKKYKKVELGKAIWYAGGIMDWENLLGSHRGVDEIDEGQFDKTEETEQATGCCMLVKSEVWRKVGLYDESYFLYYEDADLSKRVKRAGYTIIYCPKAMVWHKNARSSGSGSPLHDYYITRNRLLFGFRYASLRTKAALFREALRLKRSGREWQKRGVDDFFKRRFGEGTFEIK